MLSNSLKFKDFETASLYICEAVSGEQFTSLLIKKTFINDLK